MLKKQSFYVVLAVVVGMAFVAIIAHATSTISTNVSADVTRATGDLHSFQSLSGDLTLEGAAGGTGAFQAGVMGHLHGDSLTNSNGMHAGVIGGYSVTTSDASPLPKAGVVGDIGIDGPTTVPDGAFMAVIDGDSGVVTGNAAYGVQYLNSTAGSHFNYGLDLSHAAAGYAAVTFGVADIRLSSGITISSGASLPATCVKGSLFETTGDTKTHTCTATDTWSAGTVL
jgi:hypothetical protein